MSTDSRFLDLEMVQEYIKQDLDQNEYFRYEHDIDFSIPEQDEFFDCLDSIDDRTRITKPIKIQQNVSPVSEISSIESLDEEFQFDMNDAIHNKKVISIFTLKQDFFDNEHNGTLFLKNVDMLKQKHLEEFHHYIKRLSFGGGTTLDSQQYSLLQQFIAVLVEIVKRIDDMFRYQTKWLELEPVITLQNLFQAFSFQWERFQDYTTALIDKSAVTKMRSSRIFDFNQLQKGIDFYLTYIDEQQNDFDIIQQSTLESLIIFKIRELLQLNEHFIHIRQQSQLAKRIRFFQQICRSRVKVYKLLKDKVTFSAKKQRKSQMILALNHVERCMYIDPSVRIESMQLGEPTCPSRVIQRRTSLQMKNMNSNYNTYYCEYQYNNASTQVY